MLERKRRRLRVIYSGISQSHPQNIYFRISLCFLKKQIPGTTPGLLKVWPGIRIEQTLPVLIMQAKVRRTVSGQSIGMNRLAQIRDLPLYGYVSWMSCNLFESSSFTCILGFINTFLKQPLPFLFSTHTELSMTFFCLSIGHRL